jgi:hypothetical protein
VRSNAAVKIAAPAPQGIGTPEIRLPRRAEPVECEHRWRSSAASKNLGNVVAKESNMKMLSIAGAAFLLTVSVLLCAAEQPKSKYVVVDMSKTETEIDNPLFHTRLNYPSMTGVDGDAVFVDANDRTLAIPQSSVISMVRDGDKFSIKYQWLQKERSVTGKVAEGSISGHCDFGDFSLGFDKLQSLKCNGHTTSEASAPHVMTATIDLFSGQSIAVADIRRYYSYYSTAGYLIGGATCHEEDPSFVFKRGDSVAKIAFADIRSIVITESGEVTVVLTNSKTATGKLSANGGKDGFDGIRAVSEDGPIFIHPKVVKSIRFGTGSTTATSRSATSSSASPIR